jgi:hypothetical protein
MSSLEEQVAEPANVDRTNNHFSETRLSYYKIKKQKAKRQINGAEYDG